MKRFWQILALVLLALMVPASVCCYGADGCANVEAAHDHDHEDGHHTPTSCPSETLSRSQLPTLVTMPELQMVELSDLIWAMTHLQDGLAIAVVSSVLPMTTAPPEMRARWHFTVRAASLARAPTIVA
jgi:hypothetical protein